MEPFISFTGHLSSDWQLKPHCLETRIFALKTTTCSRIVKFQSKVSEDMKKGFSEILCLWPQFHVGREPSLGDSDGGICRQVHANTMRYEKRKTDWEIPEQVIIHNVITRWGTTFDGYLCSTSWQQEYNALSLLGMSDSSVNH